MADSRNAQADGRRWALIFRPRLLMIRMRRQLYVALQKQLGLKLESTKANADVMVVDHVEKPVGELNWTEDAVPAGSPPIRK